MQPLDLKQFVWLNKTTKENAIIIAITHYKNDDIVVYRDSQDRSRVTVKLVDDFCKEYDATYQLN